jgi:hypothetical protein
VETVLRDDPPAAHLERAHRDAHELRTEAHDWLREIVHTLRNPVGLRQHRELLVSAGWLAFFKAK